MTDVVDLEDERDARRLVWVCNCGCTVHRCFADGVIECAECEAVGSGYEGEWRVRLPAEPEAPREAGSDTFKVVRIDTAEMFLRRALKRGDGETAVAVIILDCDGAMSTFSDEAAASRPEWLWAKVTAAVRRMVRYHAGKE